MIVVRLVPLSPLFPTNTTLGTLLAASPPSPSLLARGQKDRSTAAMNTGRMLIGPTSPLATGRFFSPSSFFLVARLGLVRPGVVRNASLVTHVAPLCDIALWSAHTR